MRDYQVCKAVQSLACNCLLLQCVNAACRPQQFEAEGIDGISNGQTVDLRTVPRVESLQPAKPVVQKSAVLNRTFYDSEEDDEDEEHELGCACCPGGRNVVFRVY